MKKRRRSRVLSIAARKASLLAGAELPLAASRACGGRKRRRGGRARIGEGEGSGGRGRAGRHVAGGLQGLIKEAARRARVSEGAGCGGRGRAGAAVAKGRRAAGMWRCGCGGGLGSHMAGNKAPAGQGRGRGGGRAGRLPPPTHRRRRLLQPATLSRLAPFASCRGPASRSSAPRSPHSRPPARQPLPVIDMSVQAATT